MTIYLLEIPVIQFLTHWYNFVLHSKQIRLCILAIEV